VIGEFIDRKNGKSCVILRIENGDIIVMYANVPSAVYKEKRLGSYFFDKIHGVLRVTEIRIGG